MGEKVGETKEEKGSNDAVQAKKVDGGATTIVLKVDLHCEGCAKKVSRSIKHFEAPISDGGGTQVPFAEAGTDSHLHPNSLGFHSTIAVLKRAFELATTQTQVCYCTLDEIGSQSIASHNCVFGQRFCI
ncbi:Vacuolar protein sorting-associated protein atg6 [Dionaea muscipula]